MFDPAELDNLMEKFLYENTEEHYKLFSGRSSKKDLIPIKIIEIIDEIFSDTIMEEKLNFSKKILFNLSQRIQEKEKTRKKRISDKYRSAFTLSLVPQIRESIASTESPEEKRYLKYLLNSLIINNIGLELENIDVKPPKKIHGHIKVNGEKIPYEDIEIRLSKEPDRQKREKIIDDWKPLIIEREPMNIKIFEAYLRSFSKVGYENTQSLYKDTLNVDYSSLIPLSESLISRTESLYKSALHERLEKLGIPVSEANSIDLGFAGMGNEFDDFFREDLLMPTFESTLKGLGIDLEHIKIERIKKIQFFYDLIDKFRSKPRKKIILDLKYRSGKCINPVCLPSRIPEKSYVIIQPLKGFNYFAPFGHEICHALNFAFMDSSLPFVFKYGGDFSVNEAYAHLFYRLPFNPEWLKDHIPLKNSITDFMEFANFNKILDLRWLIVSFLTEFELESRKKIEGIDDFFSKTFKRVMHANSLGLGYMKHPSYFVRCGKYLRSYILEAQLEKYLQQNFGGLKWYKSKEAGNFLKGLWSFGCKNTAEEIVRRIGYDGLDVKPLLRDLEGSLYL